MKASKARHGCGCRRPAGQPNRPQGGCYGAEPAADGCGERRDIRGEACPLEHRNPGKVAQPGCSTSAPRDHADERPLFRPFVADLAHCVTGERYMRGLFLADVRAICPPGSVPRRARAGAGIQMVAFLGELQRGTDALRSRGALAPGPVRSRDDALGSHSGVGDWRRIRGTLAAALECDARRRPAVPRTLAQRPALHPPVRRLLHVVFDACRIPAALLRARQRPIGLRRGRNLGSDGD